MTFQNSEKSMMQNFTKKLEELAEQFQNIENQLGDPAVMSNREKLKELSREHAELLPVIQDYRQWETLNNEENDLKSLLSSDESEIAEMAEMELSDLQAKKEQIEERLKDSLQPKDPNEQKNTILEIRAGTGGDEAGLFAGDLFRMYSRYAENRNWNVEILSSNPTDRGGFKEVIFMISGGPVYSRLRFEGGTHRVQRVPETEAQGRIHTSAATVAVLPEADEVEIDINPEEIRVDVYRSSGPGGQSVNTTDSAVRITHVPTGLVVSCQDEKSQHKNKAKALKVLRSRLLDLEQSKQAQEQHAQRRTMVGSGDRSERIRTYNFPQSRLTDHRINFTSHRLESIMEGELDEVIDALIQEERSEV
jgi:peptide chain release factor 1